MKTTIIASLGLFAMALAQQNTNVLIDLDPGLRNSPTNGRQRNLEVPIGGCATIPAPFAGDISSLAVNGGFFCLLYSDATCTSSDVGGPVRGRVEDLGAWDNRIRSLRCSAN